MLLEVVRADQCHRFRYPVDRAARVGAAYGLVFPDIAIPHYDVTSTRFSASDRQRWAQGIHDELLVVEGAGRIYCLHAGTLYGRAPAPLLERSDARVEVPLKGLQIGEQLA